MWLSAINNYLGSQLKQTAAISITTMASWNSSSGSWKSSYDPKAYNKNGKYDTEEDQGQWKYHTPSRNHNGGEAANKWAKTEPGVAQQWTDGAD